MIATSTHQAGQDGPPKRILLATDLSSRCDRAQERAIRLAEQWGARLFILHVLPGTEPDEVPSWRRGHSEAAQVAERRIRADLQDGAAASEIILAQGEPAATILHQATERDCQLIVTGVARDEMMGRAALGQIVEQLIRKSTSPVLVVKGRAHGLYGEILVATDYSATSRHAVAGTLQLFPDSQVTLLHAFQVPFEGFISRHANLARPIHRAAAAAGSAV
jgi:nucleotide-binding universal stress UspA family protein